MNMRLPDSGSLFGSLLDFAPTGMANGGTTLENVTEVQLLQAIDAMQRSEIEFVVLEDGAAFLQAAGEGAGPYWVQFNDGTSDDMVEIPDGVDAETMRAVMRAFRSGDSGWRGGRVWVPC